MYPKIKIINWESPILKKAKSTIKIADLAIPIQSPVCSAWPAWHQFSSLSSVVFAGDGDDVGLLAFDSALAAAGRP